MSTNPMQAKLDELIRQQQEAAAQSEDIAKQLRAALRREADLQQQAQATQTKIAQLGLMQIGQKMMLRAELDSIRKKQTGNKQLQDSLQAKQVSSSGMQAALAEQIAQLQADMAQLAAELRESAAEMPAAQESVPVLQEAEGVPAAAAPAPKPRSRKPSSVRKPLRRPAKRVWDALTKEEQISQFLEQLEAFYPEHQVFALDSICPELGKRLTVLSALNGCESPAAFLAAQGWQMVSLAQAKALRAGKFCTPGEEPEVIRPRLNSVLRRLEKHYPDHTILRSIQHDHKSLAQDVSGLYQWLGYPGAAELLTAYGFRYEVPAGGRPATDAAAVLDAVRAVYAADAKPRTIAQIMSEHPEYAGALKTLQNQAPARFGMPLRQYLTQQGILAGSSAADI